MNNQSLPRVIFTATPDQLSCRRCYIHLWSTAVSLSHLSSAGWITAIEELFRDLDVLHIQIRRPNGELFQVPYIFEIFPDDNEAGRRWVSNFRKVDVKGKKPRYHCRCILKLTCIELLLQATVAKYIRHSDTPRCSSTHMPLGW
ncbi:MAG: hypothetical protein NW701_17895 [Nitrospira sp.]